MFLISHRGNLNGPNPETENTVAAVDAALAAGFNCEIDVWYEGGEFYLGHDRPTHQVSERFLRNPHLWCHAKNLEALDRLIPIGVHTFWHESDERTLTSKGYIWTYPGQGLGKRSICVYLGPLDHVSEKQIAFPDIAGICGDYIGQYK